MICTETDSFPHYYVYDLSSCKRIFISRTTLHSKVKVNLLWMLSKQMTPEEEGGLVMRLTDLTRAPCAIMWRKSLIINKGHASKKTDQERTGFTTFSDITLTWASLQVQLCKQSALVTPRMIRNCFMGFESLLKEGKTDDAIWKEPERWFNADEMGFSFCPNSAKLRNNHLRYTSSRLLRKA